MATIVGHLSVEELGQRYRTSGDACAARHFQAIWLLAQGMTLTQVASTTGMATRWLERLARRYNEQGPDALGDRRRGNGAERRILTPELLDKLKTRLADPPPDGGVWTTPKIAVWMAQQLGLVSVFPQRAWDALQAIGWSIQAPRPRHPQSAGPEEAAAFKKTRRRGCPGTGQAPGPDGRSLCHRRTSDRTEADLAPHLGAERAASHRLRPSPL